MTNKFSHVPHTYVNKFGPPCNFNTRQFTCGVKHCKVLIEKNENQENKRYNTMRYKIN